MATNCEHLAKLKGASWTPDSGSEAPPVVGKGLQASDSVSRVWHALAVLGPRLVTGAADDDPSGIATYSQVGAQFGYQLSWILLFSYPLMAVTQAIAARIGCVTGRGIAQNLRRHYPRWLLRIVVALLLVANVAKLGADLGAMGSAVQLLVGGPALVYTVVLAGKDDGVDKRGAADEQLHRRSHRAEVRPQLGDIGDEKQRHDDAQQPARIVPPQVLRDAAPGHAADARGDRLRHRHQRIAEEKD